jgi:hypothetical protein
LILFRLRVSSPVAAFQPRTFLLDFLMRKLPNQILLEISAPIIAQASLSLVQATLFKFSSAPKSIQSVIISCDLFPSVAALVLTYAFHISLTKSTKPKFVYHYQ